MLPTGASTNGGLYQREASCEAEMLFWAGATNGRPLARSGRCLAGDYEVEISKMAIFNVFFAKKMAECLLF